jgi:hypothetical protein
VTLPVIAFDPTDIATVPGAVRRAAFNAAMVALQEHLRLAGFCLDAIAELEVIDDELRRIVEAVRNGRGAALSDSSRIGATNGATGIGTIREARPPKS